jgi:hypothetical protein
VEPKVDARSMNGRSNEGHRVVDDDFWPLEEDVLATNSRRIPESVAFCRIHLLLFNLRPHRHPHPDVFAVFGQ